MALIPCVECGREVSTRASTCPACGCPVVESERGLVEVSADEPVLKAAMPPPRAVVQVQVSAPNSLGETVSGAARGVARAPIWRRLLQTLWFLVWIWGFLVAAVGVFIPESPVLPAPEPLPRQEIIRSPYGSFHLTEIAERESELKFGGKLASRKEWDAARSEARPEWLLVMVLLVAIPVGLLKWIEWLFARK